MDYSSVLYCAAVEAPPDGGSRNSIAAKKSAKNFGPKNPNVESNLPMPRRLARKE
jgi:hypothetical protein